MVSSIQCDFDVDVTRRIIDHDSLGKPFQSSYTCVIRAPPGHHTRVKFSTFRLPHFTLWMILRQDWLYVYDGNTTKNTLLGTFTGTKRSFTVQSSSSFMMIQLKKKYSFIRSSFKASYNYTKTKGKLIFMFVYRGRIHHIRV